MKTEGKVLHTKWFNPNLKDKPPRNASDFLKVQGRTLLKETAKILSNFRTVVEVDKYQY